MLSKSFTLIELLVVIAIVGILAGIIIVSMTNATDQATLAKAKAFSVSMRDSMANNIISEWSFDELTSATSGTTIRDSWGNNAGILSTGTSDANNKSVSGVNCIFGKCLNFDNTEDMIRTPNIALPGEYSLAFWANRRSSVGYDMIFGHTTETAKFGFDAGNQRLYVRAINGGTNIKYGSIPLNTWNYIVFSRDSSNKIWVSVNGSKKINLYSDTEQVGTVNIDTIGSDGGNCFDGLIDDIRIYSKDLSISEIKHQYLSKIEKYSQK